MVAEDRPSTWAARARPAGRQGRSARARVRAPAAAGAGVIPAPRYRLGVTCWPCRGRRWVPGRLVDPPPVVRDRIAALARRPGVVGRSAGARAGGQREDVAVGAVCLAERLAVDAVPLAAPRAVRRVVVAARLAVVDVRLAERRADVAVPFAPDLTARAVVVPPAWRLARCAWRRSAPTARWPGWCARRARRCASRCGRPRWPPRWRRRRRIAPARRCYGPPSIPAATCAASCGAARWR